LLSGWLHDLTGAYTVSIVFSMTMVFFAVSPFLFSRTLRQFD